MNTEMRELLLNVLRLHGQALDLADRYGPDYPELSEKLKYLSMMALPVAHELTDIMGGWEEPGVHMFEDVTLLDEGPAPDWDDAQYEPFVL